ncbi:hypothetical protein [Streptomyces sp. NPDC003015]
MSVVALTCLFFTAGGTHPAAAATASGNFVPLGTVSTIFDTTGSGGTALSSDSTTAVQVLGQGGVPTSGVTAVSLRVEAQQVNTTTSGYVQLYPDGTSRPTPGSLINVSPGDTADNSAVIQVGADGKLAVYNHTGPTNLKITVDGYFNSDSSGTTSGGFVPTTQTRLVNTRDGIGADLAQIPAGGTIDVQVDGVAGITGESALYANFTVPSPGAAGSLYAYPAGGSPSQPVMTFDSTTSAVTGTVAVGTNGMITLKNGSATQAVDVIVDAFGFFTAGSSQGGAFTAVQTRLLDTRATSTIAADGSVNIQIGGANGIPTSFGASMLNLTSLSQAASGYLYAFPTNGPLPETSLDNFPINTTTATSAIIQPSASGSITVVNHSSGTINLIVDLEGWFSTNGVHPASEPAPDALYTSAPDTTPTTGTDTSDPAYAAATQNSGDAGITITPDSAYGWTYFGGTTSAGGYDIPNGQLHGEVDGSGLTVRSAGGDFVTWHSMCEWNIDQVWYDSSGHIYRTDRTSTHNKCTGYGGTKYVYSGGAQMRAGKSCTVLYVEWRQVRLAAVCHTIHS